MAAIWLYQILAFLPADMMFVVQPHGHAYPNAVYEHELLYCGVMWHGTLQILKPPARSRALQ